MHDILMIPTKNCTVDSVGWWCLAQGTARAICAKNQRNGPQRASILPWCEWQPALLFTFFNEIYLQQLAAALFTLDSNVLNGFSTFLCFIIASTRWFYCHCHLWLAMATYLFIQLSQFLSKATSIHSSHQMARTFPMSVSGCMAFTTQKHI